MTLDVKTPYCAMTEQTLLAAFIFSPEHIRDAIESLTDDHFFHASCKILWQQIRLDFINGRPINFVDLNNRMMESGLLTESIRNTLTELIGFSVQDFGSWAIDEAVQSLDRLKTLRASLGPRNQLTEALEAFNLTDARESAQKLLESLSVQNVQKGNTLFEIGLDVLTTTGDITKRGIASGFGWLDSKLGGLQPGALIIVAAPRGGGKSAIVTQIVWNVVNMGKPCAIYSREMDKRSIFQRICCIEGVHSSAWNKQRFTTRESETIKRVASNKTTPLRVYDDLSNISDICARIRLDHIRFGTRVVIVDYIQLVRGDKKEGREREVSGVAWQLKELALALQITILAPSQLNKDMQARESGDIENHCDQMLVIAKSVKEGEEDSGKRLVKITKNRNGESDCRCIYQFTGENYRFHEVEETTADIITAKEKQQRD